MANAVAYGFHHLKDVFNQRVTDAGVDVVNDAITQTIEEHRRQLDAILPLVAQRTTEYKTTYRAPIRTRNQPLDESGRARPIKGAAKYEVAFPIESSGNAWGYDWKAGQKMTVEEANNATLAIVDGDRDWVFDHMLSGLYDNTTWPFTDDQHGALTIQPLANGDTTTYQLFGGAAVGATDDHYLAQANAIGAGADNPYPNIFAELDEHPENGTGQVIAFVPSGLKAATMALGTFNPIADPNIQPGNSSDRLVGTLGITIPGRLFGYEDSGVWLVEWRRLPANYIIAVHTGGPPPLAMREEPETALQGLVEIAPSPARSNYPWYERQWVRYAGFGGWNRVGALVQRVGSGTYAIPTGYTNPIL